MPPVAAVSLVFLLVLSAVLWIYLIRLSFGISTVMGIAALIFPPLPLLLLLANSEHRRQLALLSVAILLLSSIVALPD
ncbi:hypothetical protein [Microbulbifer sp. HZ11]|uniref:hypothetical protein n=1 Tax=unclassified Microbulbifer TaxID=2619833 RepID=UPI0005BAD339|nr:hypothetical protein [Microbulbifer sp. HZ11]